MRRAHDQDWLIIDGKFVGVNLGADYCAEHEWGIKKLREKFGMKDNVLGIDGRTITAVPNLLFYKEKKNTVLAFVDDWSFKKIQEDNMVQFKKDVTKGSVLGELSLYGEQSLATAWDEGTFGILAKTDIAGNDLEDLYNAFQQKDVAIWRGGGGVFQNAGLVVAIRSRVPEDAVKLMYDTDLDHKLLKEAAEKTQIHKVLEKAEKRYFALSPKWAPDIKDSSGRTKFDVIFWLNPMEQDKNRFGWFTVEELEQWAKNEAPIPYTPQEIEQKQKERLKYNG